jgi:hypothetical protein
LKEAFYNFDTDHDGYLTVEELRHICTNISDPLPSSEMEEFLREADPNGSGKIDWNALAEMFWVRQTSAVCLYFVSNLFSCFVLSSSKRLDKEMDIDVDCRNMIKDGRKWNNPDGSFFYESVTALILFPLI